MSTSDPDLTVGEPTAFDRSVRSHVDGDILSISNAYYTVKFNTVSGQLLRIQRMPGQLFPHSAEPAVQMAHDAILPEVLIASDVIGLVLIDGDEVVRDSDSLVAQEFLIQDTLDFYHRVKVRYAVYGFLHMERTYEFTRSRHVYLQTALFLDGLNEGQALNPVQRIKSLSWTLTQRRAVNLAASPRPLYLREVRRDDLGDGTPSQPATLGHLEFTLGPNGKNIARPVYQSKFAGTQDPAELRRNEEMLICGVVSVDAQSEVADLATVLGGRAAQFYAGRGLRCDDAANQHFGFSIWNHYQVLNDLIPHTPARTACAEANEDSLIRSGLHLTAKMQAAQWWPRHVAWASGDISYPGGDIFTANSRCFPQLLYTWALLSSKSTSKAGKIKWVHSPCDADLIYHTLQELYRHFVGTADVANFEDLRDSAVPYLSYSASRKEVNGSGRRGVLNTHSEALHFAWAMIGASDLFGDAEAAAKWSALVMKYHAGSRRLFDELYPARHNGVAHWGLLQYAIGSSKMEPWYASISYRGMASGYHLSGDTQLEFVDAIEAVTLGNFDPLGEYATPADHGVWTGRLCRVFPPAICFAGDSIDMVGGEYPQAADVRELLTIGLLRAGRSGMPADAAKPRRHDRHRMIAEADDRRLILTNRDFLTTWVPGFWEEVELTDVVANRRYAVWAQPELPGQYWVASFASNFVHLMANFETSQFVVTFPNRHLKWEIYAYFFQDHRWLSSGQPFQTGEKRLEPDLPVGIDVSLPNLTRKGLTVILFESDDHGPSIPLPGGHDMAQARLKAMRSIQGFGSEPKAARG